MIVYKFKSLENEKLAKEAFEIIEDGRIYLSRWDKLNDPIEGYFSYWNEDFALKVSDEKKSYHVCSFSRFYANSLLWSYYANGFKGVCIAVEINDPDLRNVKYLKRIPEYEHWDERAVDEIAKDALSTKLDYWKHEAEVRLIKSKSELDGFHYYSCNVVGVFYGSLIDPGHKLRLLGLCADKIGHGEIQVNTDSGLSTCYGVSNNVTLMNRATLPSVRWVADGAGRLQGSKHQDEERKCHICEVPDIIDPSDPYGFPSFLEEHIIDSSNAVYDRRNTALVCPSCHRRLHLDDVFSADHYQQLIDKNNVGGVNGW